MTNHSGVVALDGGDVQVTVGLDEAVVRLLAGDAAVGEWASGECEIIDNGDGTWAIAAEDETLSFLPDDPDGFAQVISGASHEVEAVAHPPSDPSGDGFEILESPPPRPLTMVAFYLSAGLTGALGVWALISLFA